LGLAPPAAAEQPIAIIANERWERASELSLSTLRRIYLGKITRLYGKRVERFHLPSGSEVREGFSRSVFGKSDAELEDYWLEQALTGGHPPPREFSSAREIVEEVARRPNAIGYVDYRELMALGPASVRIVRIAGRDPSWHPEEPGYPIHHR
jgi:ABC-type phosphate transport system substrate-binding protein